MSDIAIKFENISKQYHLGKVGTGTLSHDLNRWWAVNVLRKDDPYLKVGEVNDRSQKSSSDFVWALKDIDFEVKEGEVLGIIGKNGAGKSTLLKILSRVTTPTTGRITSYGRIASLLEVGTGFHPEMTGRENIFMNGSIMGMTKAEIRHKFDEIVDFAGIERYIETPVKRYSSGMTVRLGFAIAAHLEPEKLVVDEVLAVGDAEFQKKAIGKMQDVSKGEGRTVLFVSHNMASINALCNSAILLFNGNISSIGEVGSVIDRYLIQNSKLNQISIANRVDRTGSGSVKLVSYKIIESKSKMEVDTIISGQEIEFLMKFENYTSVTINNFEVELSFWNKNEELLFACRNSVINALSVLKPGINNVSLIFKKWPASGGAYTFNVFTSIRGEIIDWVKNVGQLKVETGDFYGSGIIPAANYQSIFTNYKFK